MGVNLLSHYTIKRLDRIGAGGNVMTYRGIHESISDAQLAIEKLLNKEAYEDFMIQIREALSPSDDKSNFLQEIIQRIMNNFRAKPLVEGEEYHPLGGLMKKRDKGKDEPTVIQAVHGVSDGTHADAANKDKVVFIHTIG